MYEYMDELPAIQLSDLNEFITCKLCKGYLIDAVSITECLHSFCKSCIVKYSEEKRECPVCGILIHQSHPLNYMSFDRTLQDIVYKIVPDLKQEERRRREVFYRSLGKTPPPSEDLGKENHELGSKENVTGTIPTDSDGLSSNFDPDYHRKDEQVNIQLEPGSDNLEPLTEKYLRLSSRATVTHLRKYVAQQVLHDISKFHEIDIFIQNNEDGTFLGRDHVLKFVRVGYWNAVEPMPLQYRYSRMIY
uniref:Polycomb group RING finger protein 3 n=1 Tax=Schistosoma japonicum TaxID=6182 RepID=C1LEU0_SCHJA|nr:Polycomb group RING finger protein 3 [Schistosoma japonicum]